MKTGDMHDRRKIEFYFHKAWLFYIYDIVNLKYIILDIICNIISYLTYLTEHIAP